MTIQPTSIYPGGSKERVNRAGNGVRERNASLEDLVIIDTWRAAHRSVLNTFQAILRTRTKGTAVIVAQRHKRRITIFGKLQRFSKMQLARMDDVAGCRLIFPNIDALYEFRKKLHKTRFNHKRKNEVNKYDYIIYPKTSGYRGIHDVYEYDVNSTHGKKYKGLLIEIQFRTIHQHAWATCGEVIGFITENQPKFEEGDKRYQEILSLSSEIIARSFEQKKSCHPNLSDIEVVRKFLVLDNEIKFMETLRNLNSASGEISKNKNIILIFSEENALETKTYRDATDAIRALFILEEQNPGKDIVLVRADTSEDVRFAFKNYFSDAREFISFIDQGCQTLAGGIDLIELV